MTKAARKYLALAATTMALIGGPAAQAVPATAATAGSVAHMAARGTAPACVTRDVIKQKKQVTVRNNCGKAMHVKVVINNAPDLQCWTYQNGEGYVWKWRVGSYGKIVTC